MTYPELFGKVALVTGGAKGLGAAIAAAFAENGASLVVCDVDEVAAARGDGTFEIEGRPALYVKGDVSCSEEVANVVEMAVARYGRIDFLINNAGVSQKRALLTELDEGEYNRVMDINVRGSWLFMKSVIPRMLDGGGGAIVNISSAMGLVAQSMVSVYAASKHAVVGLTKAAAMEFGPRNIRVNAICPGRHDTPMVAGWRDNALTAEQWEEQIRAKHPASGRMGRADEIAAATLFLCSDGASNIHGVALPVDGGWTAQ
jgi:NAD(P)-dependent dehydrogenase (short-subunit alcohol dehydrogenase family)